MQSNYPVIHPDGKITHITKCTYDAIVEHIGSPFCTAQIGPSLFAYLPDNGLFDGSEPNVPLAIIFGVPVCGPAMLFGGADHEGDSIPAVLPEGCWPTMQEVCERLQHMHRAIDQMRETPFEIIEIKNIEDILDMLGGGDG